MNCPCLFLRPGLCLGILLSVTTTLLTTTLFAEESGSGLVPLVITLLHDQDKDMRALAFDQVRTEAKGQAATKQFAAMLPQLPPEVQVGLLSALADRGDKAAQGAVSDTIASSSEERVRVAAIKALGALGNPTDWKPLVKLLSQGSESEKAAAKASLIQLQGLGVSNAIATAVEDESPAVQIALLQILTIRRAFDSIPTILDAALDDEVSVRTAAMTSLGKLASKQHVPRMVQGVLRAEKGSERAAAEKAVMFVCRRIADKDKRADPLLAAMKKLNSTQYTTMLSTLGRLGGPKALDVVEHAIAENDPAQHSAGIRALSNWPDASVAPRLLELAKSDRHPDHRTTSLRALIRVAPLPDGRTNLQRLELLQTAMEMATRDAEKTLVLQRARAIRIPETLRFVVPYLDQPKFAQQACETIVELAHHRSLREPNKAEFDRALDKVIATSKNATVIERANRYKKGQTWARPTSSNRK